VVHAGGHLLQPLLAAAHVADATKRRLSISFMQRLECQKVTVQARQTIFHLCIPKKDLNYIYQKAELKCSLCNYDIMHSMQLY
jgi:hypothetical protein